MTSGSHTKGGNRSGLSGLRATPPDGLLATMTAFRNDDRPNKVDLGVGVYRDARGRTPLMEAVRLAEIALANEAHSKTYEGPHGNSGFCDLIEALVLGDAHTALVDRTVSFATPGGCGALALAMALVARCADKPRLWLSRPHWPNHPFMARASGLAVREYRYCSDEDLGVDGDATLDDLSKVRPGDVILLQGPCHNPTGADISTDLAIAIGDIAQRSGAIVLIDIAYHGLGQSLDDDLSTVRALSSTLPEMLISYSCSKNFGLYRERTGCLIAIGEDTRSRDGLASNIADLSRASYAMPPAHGAAIVERVLNDENLRSTWRKELADMRGRLSNLRHAFSKHLIEQTGDSRFETLALQSGMFSILPMVDGGVATLADRQAVYIAPDGRVNIAGLQMDTATDVAIRLAPYLKKARNAR